MLYYSSKPSINKDIPIISIYKHSLKTALHKLKGYKTKANPFLLFPVLYNFFGCEGNRFSFHFPGTALAVSSLRKTKRTQSKAKAKAKARAKVAAGINVIEKFIAKRRGGACYLEDEAPLAFAFDQLQLSICLRPCVCACVISSNI